MDIDITGSRCKVCDDTWVPYNVKTKEPAHCVSASHEGTIIAISTTYEELNDGVGQYPVFIILKDDGSFECVYVNRCTLITDKE